MKEIKIRLDKFLSNLGCGSRSVVQKLIKRGLVKVNSEVIKNSSHKIDPSKDRIFVEDDEVLYQENYYFMLNKPVGYITATTDEYFPTVLELFSDFPLWEKLFPVGRLDKDTEGLLILTTDGQFAHRLTHPKWNIEKEYYVVVEGDNISNIDFNQYQNKGLYLKEDRYTTKPFKVKVISTGREKSEILMTISEGKYHIVKKIIQQLGSSVLYLKRTRIGNLVLDENLKPGEYRELTREEIDNLKRMVKL